MSDNKVNHKVLACYVVHMITLALAVDPCQDGNHDILSDLPKRNPSFAKDSVPICDRYLMEGWYRAPYHEMVTTAPSIGYCGTLYPYWLNGTFPANGSTEWKQSCQVGFESNCQQSHFVNITNCGKYNVYYLKPLPSCNMAYCFEKKQNCIEEIPTSPNVSFYNVVYSEKELGDFVRYDPVVNLLCKFTPLKDQNVFYYIDWYADSKIILSGQTVHSSSLSEAVLSTAYLRDQHVKIGCQIHCIIGAISNVTDVPCKTTASPLFFAGIEVLTPTLSMERKGRETVKIRLTIPFATETLYDKNRNEYYASTQDISMSFPSEISAKCQTAGSSNRCKITLEKITYDKRHMFADKSWYETYKLTIQNTDNIGFNNDIRQIALRMKTGGGGSNAAEIFNDVTLPDIHINVIESLTVWKGKQCHSHADPHMRTFDGYAYECHHTGCSTGITSILFENKEQYQQVQVRHHKCYHLNARCICAIAVRSGKDVFMFDACNGRQYINFPICDDKSLKVIKVTDKSYKIFFPTGTYVTTTLNMGEDWFLQTEIYPSVADVGKTGGLCGLLDGNYSNDLTRRTGIEDNPDDFNYHNPPDEFSISWRARNGEDLFSHSMDFDTLESLEATLMKFCSCDKGVTDCSYQKFKDCEGITKGKEYQCILHSSNKRRRRHAVFMKSFPPDPVENILQNRFKRKADYITENATIICKNAFEESHAYRICRDSVVDFPNDSVQNCILDVSLTGEQSLVDIHIESAMDQCKAFIGLNETLRIEQPEITKEIESICQNNCSYHGSCNNGSCFCDEGFGGSDCSFDITEPVNINEVLGGTLCDKSTETCNVITLFGQYFVEKMNFTCYIKVNDISIQGQIDSTATYETRLEEQTLYEANCPNPHKSISNWINELSFNISNDGKKFSRTFGIFIYKSECQIPRNESGAFIFSLATGYCFIDGKCVRNSQTQMNNRCRICDIEKDNMHWSFNEDCISSTVSTVDNMSNDAISGETTNLPSTLNAETSSIVELTQSKPISSSITTSAIFIPFTSTSPESSEPTSNLSSPSAPIIQTTESSNNANILSNKEALNLTQTTIVLIVI